jgi:hypothetical protein
MLARLLTAVSHFSAAMGRAEGVNAQDGYVRVGFVDRDTGIGVDLRLDGGELRASVYDLSADGTVDVDERREKLGDILACCGELGIEVAEAPDAARPPRRSP